MRKNSLFLVFVCLMFSSRGAFAQFDYNFDNKFDSKTEKEIKIYYDGLAAKIKDSKAGASDYYDHGLISYRRFADTLGALADFDKSIMLNDKYIDSYIARGVIYVLLAKNDQAMYNLDKAIELGPKKSYVYLFRGTINSLMDLDAAINDYNKAEQLEPSNPEVYMGRALIFTFMKDYNAALADWDKAILVQKNFPEKQFLSYYHKAELLERIGMDDEVISTYKKMMTIVPKDLTPYLKLGELYSKKGMVKEAAELYNKAVEIDKGGIQGLLARADFKANVLEDYEGALKDADATLLVEPKKFSTFAFKAYCFVKLGKFDEAIKICNQVILYEPNTVESYILRGDVYLAIGDESNMVKDFEKAILIAPDEAMAYENLIKYYVDKEDNPNIIKMLNRYLESGVVIPDEHKKTYYLVIAQSAEKIKDMKEACKAWQKAKALGSGEAEVFMIGNCP